MNNGVSGLESGNELSGILVAFTAAAIELMPMAGNGKIILFGNLALKLLYPRLDKLNDPTAAGTDKMIVVVIAVQGLEPCLPVTKVQLHGNTALGE